MNQSFTGGPGGVGSVLRTDLRDCFDAVFHAFIYLAFLTDDTSVLQKHILYLQLNRTGMGQFNLSLGWDQDLMDRYYRPRDPMNKLPPSW